MKISREDLEQVIEKACDIANATTSESNPMLEVYVEGMMILLDALEVKYGPQSQILATRADYLEEESARRVLLNEALVLAKKSKDATEIDEIMGSIADLDR